MPDVEHSTLTTTDLHEPKGVAAATSGQVYVADGAGSGAWAFQNQYGAINTLRSDTVSISSIGTTAQTLAFANDGVDSGNVTADSANNRVTVADAGTYLTAFNISFHTVASGDSGTYIFKLLDDGVATGAECTRYMSGTNDSGSASFSFLVNAGAGSHLTISVESDNGSDADDITILFCNLIVTKV